MLELLNITGAEKWSGTPVTLRVYPAPRAGGLLSSSCPRKLAPATGLAPASSSVRETRLDYFVFAGLKGFGPGGSCNLTNARLRVGCRSAVASGPKISAQGLAPWLAPWDGAVLSATPRGGKMADATGAAPARSCSTGRQTCCCYSRPKLADHRRMGMRGGDCRRQPVRALLAGARASTRRARLMAHSRHPAGCAAHSLSRSARLSGSSSLKWLPQMDSHHHRRIQSPLSYCWTTGQ